LSDVHQIIETTILEIDEEAGTEKTILRRSIGQRTRTFIRFVEPSGHETHEEQWEGISLGN